MNFYFLGDYTGKCYWIILREGCRKAEKVSGSTGTGGNCADNRTAGVEEKSVSRGSLQELMVYHGIYERLYVIQEEYYRSEEERF